MLTAIKIDNFKSFVDFALPAEGEPPLGKFVCLVGLNGSGKSSVLQAVDFLSQLVVGDVNRWLDRRGWDRTQLANKASKKRSTNFRLDFRLDPVGFLSWSGTYNYTTNKCVREKLAFTPHQHFDGAGILPSTEVVIASEDDAIRDSNGSRRELTTDYDGSVFNKIKFESLGFKDSAGNIIGLLRYLLNGVKSLELLSPQSMRKASKSGDDVGLGGEALAAFIHGLSADEQNELVRELEKFYPQLRRVGVKALQYGWKRLLISEEYGTSHDLDASLVNDGLLRITALIAQTLAKSGNQKSRLKKTASDALGNMNQKGYDVVLLDEVENGINPGIAERLVRYLLSVKQQVFVTTHSPLIINYLPDDVARDSVFLLYRGKEGTSKSKRFFSVGDVEEKLDFMGPGEVFLDVNLEDIAVRARAEEESL